MKFRKIILRSVVGLSLIAGGVAIAQHPPAENVNPNRHPNLAAAQRLTEQAYNRITAAQQANEWNMQGHAAHAKDLLDQANRELKEAAEATNKNHK